jgi:photosystem II stability/assembly factor-like uncharacterized protein
MCLHSVILDPVDLKRMYVGISAAGVFRTTDGGKTWSSANTGTRANFTPDQPPVYPEFGQCVHKMVINPAEPRRLYQQSHCGVYRSDNGGDRWVEVTKGLPADWGHGITMHPRDASAIWVCQGISGYKHWMPDGQMALYRTRDRGRNWEKLTKGLPGKDAFVHIPRDGMATDTLSPVGVYVGANTGQLFYSADEGDSWRQASTLFPPINSVGTVTL